MAIVVEHMSIAKLEEIGYNILKPEILYSEELYRLNLRPYLSP